MVLFAVIQESILAKRSISKIIGDSNKVCTKCLVLNLHLNIFTIFLFEHEFSNSFFRVSDGSINH